MNKICGIYMITSPTGKVYIGQSYNIRLRFAVHKSRSKLKKFGCKLYSSFEAHGFERHLFEIVQEFPPDTSKDVLTRYEQFYLDQYKSAGVEVLNIKELVDSSRGVKHSDETKRKVIAALTGRICSPETRKKISESQIGKIIPRDQVEKANAKKRGRKHTEEHRIKCALARTGLKRSEQACLNISNSLKGKIRSEESKRKQSESLKLNPVRYWLGKKLPEEVIRKREETRKRNRHGV